MANKKVQEKMLKSPQGVKKDPMAGYQTNLTHPGRKKPLVGSPTNLIKK